MLHKEDADRAEIVAADAAFRETLRLQIPKSISLSEDFSYLGERQARYVERALSALRENGADPCLLAGYAMRCFMYHSWDAAIHIALLTERIRFDEVENIRPEFSGGSLAPFDSEYWCFKGHRKVLLDDVYGFLETPHEIDLALALEVYFLGQAALAKQKQRIDDCLEFLGIAYELHGAIEVGEESEELITEAEEGRADFLREHKLSTDIIRKNREENMRRTRAAAERYRGWQDKASKIWKQPEHKNKSASWVAEQIAAKSEKSNTIRRVIGHLKPSHKKLS